MFFKRNLSVTMRRLAGIAITLVLAAFLHADTPYRNLAELARNAESQGYYNLAAHYYFHALKQYPNNVGLATDLAWALQKSGHFNLAEDAWNHVLQLNDSDATATAQLALLNDPVSRKAMEDAVLGGDVMAPGPKSDIPLEKGESAWVSGDPRQISTVINGYNQGAPKMQRVIYVFPNSGHLAFVDGQISFDWNPGDALVLADTLAGEARVYPVISGSSQGCEHLRPKDWEDLGKKIAAKINADDRFSGLIFEMKPQVPQFRNLLAIVKKNCDKPMGVALDVWGKEDFQYADFVVLRSLDAVSASQDQIHAFLGDARDGNGKAIVSFPGGADTFEARRKALEASVLDDDPAFVGMAVTLPVDPAVWDSLKIPLDLP